MNNSTQDGNAIGTSVLDANSEPLLVERAYYFQYGGAHAHAATISVGGLYWRSHVPTSQADATFINNVIVRVSKSTHGDRT